MTRSACRRPAGLLLAVLLIGDLWGKPVQAEPKFTVLEHPSPEQLQDGFRKWVTQYPHAFRAMQRGVTPGGRPILMGRISDYRVPDEDKQVALLTSCHVGKELNAGTGLLRFMKWLVSDDPAAAEIRKKQVVLVVPYNDAEVKEIRLDGHLLQESATDGYQLRRNPGTIVEIAIPPGKVREFHIASCFYESPTKRRSGFGPEDW